MKFFMLTQLAIETSSVHNVETPALLSLELFLAERSVGAAKLINQPLLLLLLQSYRIAEIKDSAELTNLN